MTYLDTPVARFALNRSALGSLRRAARSAYSTSAWTTLTYSLVAGATGVIATRAVGPYERGLVATAIVWSSVVGGLAAYGTPGVATYFVARDRDRAGNHAGTVMTLAALIGFAVGGVGVLASLIVASDATPALIIAFAALPLNIAAGAGVGAVLGYAEFRAWGMLRILGVMTSFLAVIAAVALDLRTAVAIVAATVLGPSVQFFVAYLYLRRGRRIQRGRRELVRPIIGYGWRNLVAGAGWLIAARMDQLVLSIAVSPRLLGVYAVAVSFGAIIEPPAQALGSVLLQRASAGGIDAARTAVPRALGGALAIGGAAVLVLLVGAPWIVRLLFGDDFDEAVTPLRLLMPGTLFLIASSILADTLRALGRPLEPARAEITAAVATVVLLPPLLSAYGIAGAAAASTLSYGMGTAVMTWRVRRVFRAGG